MGAVAHHPAMSALSGMSLAGCRLTEQLGRGAIGMVYRAVRLDTGAEVAIKVIHGEIAEKPSFIDRLEREARLAYQIDHPNLVRVHTWGQEEGRHFVVMDFIDGQTLYHLIRHHSYLRWPLAATLLQHVASAVTHVHELGIIHRDIKPENIMIGRDGLARLTDLGLARQLVDPLDEVGGRRLTDDGMAMGSPCYMAPEQIENTAQVGPAADIYGMGATLFHALTGRPPIIGEDAHQTLNRVLREAPRRASAFIRDIPSALSDLADRCLAKDPAARPPSARRVAEELAICIRQRAGSSIRRKVSPT